MKRTSTRMATIAIMCLAVSSALADTLHVPGEYDTIQAGIDAAVSGDTVEVADGTYTGPGNRDLDFGGKLITVRSENGPATCIIDCENAGRGFYFHSGETADAVVDGLTVRNAYYSGFGAGIACEYGSSPTINNCIFENGSATRGAGMYNNGSSPVVTNCVFRNNSGTYSVGMQNYGGSHPTIDNCVFIRNIAASWCGGLGNWSNCSPQVTNCLFIDNEAYGGGGMNNWSGCDPIVTNCLFVGNSAPSGGAIYNRSTSDNPTITNCTFVDNSASYGRGVYGGLPYIDNCILWNGGTGEIYGSATVTYSDVQGGWPDPGAVVASGGPLDTAGYLYTWEVNVDAGLYYDFHIYDSYGDGIFSPGGYAVYYEEILVYSCIGEGWDGFSETVESIGVGGATIRVEILTDTWPGETTWDITGPGTNIDADPQFVDSVNGDFHITHESPCMDAGDNAAVYVATDLDANPRIVGLAVDMGAYEVQDTDGDGLLNQTELDIAEGSGCPDPYDADSDDDTLSDLEEVIAGTNPCNADTDGDGLGDAIDPTPLTPGATTGWIEDACRALADEILQLDLSLFNGPNSNANAGRRTSLANRATDAANAIAIADNEGAIESLTSLLHKVDDQSPPPDWMDPSPEKTALADDVNLLIALILLLP